MSHRTRPESPPGAVVVIGAGLAGVTVLRQLRAAGFGASVVLVGEETELPYDHPPLSKELLSGQASESETRLFRDDELAALDADLRLGRRAVALHACDRQVELDDGTRLGFAHCVVATGSRVRALPGLAPLDGLLTLRSLPEAVRLRDALRGARRLVVVGAGFVGLEVAAGAVTRGTSVTVVEQQPLPLTRVLGTHGGTIVADLHRAHGVDLRCGVTVTQVVGDPAASSRRVAAVQLSDGTEVAADLVLVGVGALPNVEWLAGSGVCIDDGVVCDPHGRTSVPRVWAAGDASRWPNECTGRHQRMEQWQSALEQAGIVARNIADPARDERWQSVPYFWSDQFDTKIQFCGHAGDQAAVLHGGGGPVVGFTSAAGTLTGVLAIGQPTLIARGRRLVARGAALTELEVLVGT